MTLVDSLKILHILSATLVLSIIFYCSYQWLTKRVIHARAWLAIIPFFIFQLVTGFMMINVNEEDVFATWIIGSTICFISLIISWFSFIYFKRSQDVMIATTLLSLLCMIFFMTSKITL